MRGLAAGRGLVLWVKVKWRHREEFVVVGWTDPEGTRPWLGALPLASYEPDGRLVYAGRAGLSTAELERLWRRPATAACCFEDAARSPAAAHQLMQPLLNVRRLVQYPEGPFAPRQNTT